MIEEVDGFSAIERLSDVESEEIQEKSRRLIEQFNVIDDDEIQI